MDIKELLSPQDSPATGTSSQQPTPSPLASPNNQATRPSAQQRKSSGLNQSYTPSSASQEAHLPSHIGHASYQQQPLSVQNITSAPHQQVGYQVPPNHASSYGQAPEPSASYAQPSMHRQTSTPQMDALADLASMQQHHQAPANQTSNGLQDLHAYEQSRPSLR